MQSKKITKFHPYILHANKEIEWLPSDTMELFAENLKKQKSLLEKYNWISTKLSYKFNSEGFRTEEFYNKKGGIMFLGCSYTFGIGLPLDKTFPHIVSDELKIHHFNLALPASSNDTAFRLADLWINRLEPGLVILLSPLPDRFELLCHETKSNEDVSRFITTMDQLADNSDHLWIENEQNGLINRRKNKLAIQKICDDRGIRFLHDDSENLNVVDFARDLLHPGVESNRMFAKKLINQLRETDYLP